jgi:hopanoid-associated phosphorylase
VTVIAVTGLRAEARLAQQAGLATVCAGGAPQRTEAALAASARGATSLISFGIAGGLAPGMPAGTLVVARHVIADGERYATDPAWAETVRRRSSGIDGDVYGSGHVVATSAEKSALHHRTKAIAVDLESLAVARAAARTKIPFIIVRAIADPAERDLPLAACEPLRPDGTPDLVAILRSLAGHPGQLLRLIGTALNARRAMQRLRQAVASAGTSLARSS